jgi:hypothetical protein
MKPLTLEQLVHRSQHIVRGKVTATRSFWNRGRTRILTEVTVGVEKQLKGKGDGSGRARFIKLGGKVGRYEMRVVGSARFRVGEEVMVFLSKRRGRTYVTGMSQGKLTIVEDPQTGKKRVRRRLSGVSWTAGAKPGSFSRATLAELAYRIRALVRAERRETKSRGGSR